MLRYRADLRTLAFMATYFGLTAALWVGAGPLSLDAARAWGAPQWAAGVALFALASFFSFFCAVATHNTVHSPVFKSRAHNRIFQAVLTLTYGHPVSAFVPGHNLSHHKHTQTPRDVMRTTKVRFRWHLLNGLFFMLSVAPAIMKGESRYFAAMKTRMPAWFRQLRVEQITLYAVYAVLLYLDWKKFLLFVFIPHKYAAWGIISMNMLQHDGCDQDDKYNHSRNFVGKLVNWFTFNNGFHSIHHDHPGLHWSLTPEAHAKAYAPYIHPALDQKSLAAYIFTTFIWPGKRLRYDGTPLVLPARSPDEEWVPKPEETKDDLGAIAPAI